MLQSISFVASSNIMVSRLTSINSQMFHISIDQCHNITLENMKISAPSWSPNTDGIHMQSSTGISITNSMIKTGDDCISIGPGSKNLRIHRIACGPGHGIRSIDFHFNCFYIFPDWLIHNETKLLPKEKTIFLLTYL